MSYTGLVTLVVLLSAGSEFYCSGDDLCSNGQCLEKVQTIMMTPFLILSIITLVGIGIDEQFGWANIVGQIRNWFDCGHHEAPGDIEMNDMGQQQHPLPQVNNWIDDGQPDNMGQDSGQDHQQHAIQHNHQGIKMRTDNPYVSQKCF